MRKLVSFCIAVMLSVIVIGLVACGGDSDEDAEGAGTGPSVSYLVPRNKADRVPTTTAFQITFNEDVVTPSAANLSFSPGVSGTVSYDAFSRTMTFRPSSALSQSADYSMTVSGVANTEGETMSPLTISFRTSSADTTPPKITATFPEDKQEDLGHDTEIRLRFSEPVDRPKLRAGISFTPGVVVARDDWNFEWGTAGDEEVTITAPRAIDPFEVDEDYAVGVSASSVVDLSGNPMTSNYSLRFKTLQYPVEQGISPNIASSDPVAAWIFVVGRRGGTWVVKWGGSQPQGAAAGGNPSGTITASADGRISDNVDGFATRRDEKVTYSVSSGNGNRLTFSSSHPIGNVENAFGVRFSSTSSYLIFSLSPGTTEYINIGTKREHPSKSRFVLVNE